LLARWASESADRPHQPCHPTGEPDMDSYRYEVKYFDADLSRRGKGGVRTRSFAKREDADAFAAANKLYAQPCTVFDREELAAGTSFEASTPCQLGGDLVALAQRYAPALPKQARAILMMAAGIYQETGEPDLSIRCQETAAAIKEATELPRSRPFCPPAIPLRGASGPEPEPGLGAGRVPSELLATVSGRGRRS
jgi:hypothetical protein